MDEINTNGQIQSPSGGTQDEVVQQLKRQNELLSQQNRMLQELIAKTPDRNDVKAGFNEQLRHLDIITKAQKTESLFGWVKFILIAVAALVMFYFLYRIWGYFGALNQTLSRYAEQFSSAFGGLEESLGQIEEFFSKLKEFLHLG